ncbi:hypothetical protein HCO69_12185 [Pantoea sp. LS15]|uniref:hypothetical protein n=1 Tax=Enterobacterales TaxID=91347 RepID=UPI000E0FC536|nr:MULTISPECIES: hypothetical protein [Enterobacterales]NJQ20386.1 hypothetical protein [Pantoea sp. LS15]NKF46982.1 hypothetical protein [Pantoea sp. LS15]RDK14228.1 hypothetical protein CEJ32_12450 [Enterobacter sp. 9-2]
MKIMQVLCIMLVISNGACANDCTSVKEMDKADNTASAIQGWQGVYSFYKNYSQCDDGYIAEEVSATVVELLANKWNSTPQLILISDTDNAFNTWILNHINTTTNDRDLQKVMNNARELCPENNQPFCKKIENAAQAALQELQNQ